MNYWVIKNANGYYWANSDWEWTAKESDAIKFVGKSDAQGAIANIDIDSEDSSMIPYEVRL